MLSPCTAQRRQSASCRRIRYGRSRPRTGAHQRSSRAVPLVWSPAARSPRAQSPSRCWTGSTFQSWSLYSGRIKLITPHSTKICYKSIIYEDPQHEWVFSCIQHSYLLSKDFLQAIQFSTLDRLALWIFLDNKLWAHAVFSLRDWSFGIQTSAIKCN